MTKKMELIVDGERITVSKVESVDYGIVITASMTDLLIEAVEGKRLCIDAIDKNVIGIGAYPEEDYDEVEDEDGWPDP